MGILLACTGAEGQEVMKEVGYFLWDRTEFDKDEIKRVKGGWWCITPLFLTCAKTQPSQ